MICELLSIRPTLTASASFLMWFTIISALMETISRAFQIIILRTNTATTGGESLNFDDFEAHGVREFFISNARHWISEYQLDGFRFDATQAILDDSNEHILSEISKAARQAAG